MVGLVTMGMVGANVGWQKTEIKSLKFIKVNRLKSITNKGKHGPCSVAIAMKLFTKSSRRETCHLAKLVKQVEGALRWLIVHPFQIRAGATLQLGQQREVCCILPKENNEHLCRILAGATLQLGQQSEVCCVLPKENNGHLCRTLAGATLQLGQ